MRRRHLVIFAAVVIFSVVTWSWRDRGQPRVVRELAPGLDPELAQALTVADDADLAALLRDRGAEVAVSSYGFLRAGLAPSDSGATGDRRQHLLPAMQRMAVVLEQEYLLPEFLRDVAYWRQIATGRSREVAWRFRRMNEVFGDGSRDPQEVRRRLEEDLAYFRAVEYPFGVVHALSHLATNALKRGQGRQSRELFETCLDQARRWDLRPETCDALCSLAMHDLMASGDRAARYLEEALILARESRLAGLAGRAHAIAGVHAHERGHFALGCDQFEEAVRVCRELGQPALGLPSLVTLLRFYAAFGDWDRIEALLPRARSLAVEAETAAAAGLWPDPLKLRSSLLRLSELEARTLLARGRVQEAETIYPGLLTATRRLPLEETAYTYDFRCQGLLSAGRPDLAAAAAESALAYAEAVPLPEWAIRFRLHAARAYFELGDPVASRRELDAFVAAAPGHEVWIEDLKVHAHALRARLRREEQDPEGAAAALAVGLADLVETLNATDASSRAYLELDRAGDLRRAIHELLTTDTRTGYGLELFWRRLPGWLGGGGKDAPTAGEDLTRRADDLARVMQAWLGRRDAVHLMYRQEPQRLLRWVADATSVRCDTLAVTTTMLAGQVSGALRQLGADPGDPDAPVGGELVARTRDLAEMLLPPILLTAEAGPELVVVSADGALALLPFTVLNLATPPEYRPLVAVRQVARVRGSGSGNGRRAVTRSLVVAAPNVAPHLRRRYPGLADLTAGQDEAGRIAALLPGAELLVGAAATPEALRSAWTDADCLYFACHTVRHPEMPYRCFLPLTPASGGGPAADAALLDIVDIRAHDFSGVQLVVLASCASGVPYVASGISAPSLADAFLDAGVSATVQTLWRVRDEGPAHLLETCLRGWREEGLSLPDALGRAQRDAMERSDGRVRHPFDWAAFEVNLRGP